MLSSGQEGFVWKVSTQCYVIISAGYEVFGQGSYEKWHKLRTLKGGQGRVTKRSRPLRPAYNGTDTDFIWCYSIKN